MAFALTFLVGLLCWLPARTYRKELRLRDGFVVVVLFWTALSMVGALPFMLAEHPHMSFTDAVFESVSGFTTTGATVIIGLEQLPQSVLYYRQQLQFLGGMGIVVLAVAIFPISGRFPLSLSPPQPNSNSSRPLVIGRADSHRRSIASGV